MNVAILLVLAYLIGSIPTAVWVSKWVYGIDIREHGSGNAGATNAFRILGSKAGAGVMFGDMAKKVSSFAVKALFPPKRLINPCTSCWTDQMYCQAFDSV